MCTLQYFFLQEVKGNSSSFGFGLHLVIILLSKSVRQKWWSINLRLCHWRHLSPSPSFSLSLPSFLSGKPAARLYEHEYKEVHLLSPSQGTKCLINSREYLKENFPTPSDHCSPNQQLDYNLMKNSKPEAFS